MGRLERFFVCLAGLGGILYGIFFCDKIFCKVFFIGMDFSGGGIGLGFLGVLDFLEFLFECGGDKTFEFFLFFGGFSGLEYLGDSLSFCFGGGKLGIFFILVSEFLEFNFFGKGVYKFFFLDDEFRDFLNILLLFLFVELVLFLLFNRFLLLFDGKDILVFFVLYDIFL